MRLFTFIAVLFFGFVANAQTADDFVFSAEIEESDFFTHTYSFIVRSSRDINVDWGDGQNSTYPASDFIYATHEYATVGIYDIIINGNIDSFKISGTGLIEVQQWGSSQFLSMKDAFQYCDTLVFSATDLPDVSMVSDFSYTFANSEFNSDISQWDVSSATTMENMFTGCTTFNQPINTWDVSNVTTMKRMFSHAFDFNQPLDNWDVSNVNDMSSMFQEARSFDQNINTWNVSNVTDMDSMFSSTDVFNMPLDNWDVSNVTDFAYMFTNATLFNQSIDVWDVSSAVNLYGMFYGTQSFNQPLNSWDVSNVTSIRQIFASSQSFNQPLDMWDVANVTDMYGAFFWSDSFNQNLNSWDFNLSANISNLVAYSNLDTSNYDALLRRFLELEFTMPFSGFSAINLTYCDSFTRNILSQNGFTTVGDELSTNCEENLRGKVSLDLNSNGCDLNDNTVDAMSIRISNQSYSTELFLANGHYNTNLGYGTYTITPIVDTNLFTVSPPFIDLNINDLTSLTSQDFCISPIGSVDKADVTIMPLEDARPGFDTSYKIIYQNTGNVTFSGTVEFEYPENYMEFSSSSPITNTVMPGVLSWDFIDLDPFESREIIVTMNLNPPTDPNYPLNAGNELTFGSFLSHNIPNNTPSDARFSLEQTVVNSFDPNDKACLQGETILPTMVGEYVHYRIRFENEGTASAVNVRIVDYIDTSKFDLTTLTPLSASHDYTTTITQGNKVEFLFDNIMLPFTAPASQGYVLFKIKTIDTLVLGDDFTNQAEIYFDFNFPIITNLERTEVAVPLSLNDSNLFEVSLYPNPAQNTISLNSNLEFNEYTIYDALGAVVARKKLENATLNQDIQVDHLVSGFFFVEVKGDNISSVLKLIKE